MIPNEEKQISSVKDILKYFPIYYGPRGLTYICCATSHPNPFNYTATAPRLSGPMLLPDH